MFTFTRWADMFGDQVSKIHEKRSGYPRLTYNDDFPEAWLEALWRAQIKPAEAARVMLALKEARLIV